MTRTSRPGAPWTSDASTYTWVNTLYDAIVVITITNSVTGASSGIVMCRKRCHADAPSTAAASS